MVRSVLCRPVRLTLNHRDRGGDRDWGISENFEKKKLPRIFRKPVIVFLEFFYKLLHSLVSNIILSFNKSIPCQCRS